MSMIDPTAASQHVSINTTAPSSYNVVCNKCISSPKFTHFDDFLDHSHAEHGPTVRRSALSIIPEDALISARGSISHLSAQSGVSTNFSGSSVSSKNDNEFDLRTLKRQCTLDVIALLNKCFCIWHRPTRVSMPRSERLYAYQLVLMKLREHIPFVTFRDARSIVRQIIRCYLRRQRLAEGDGISRKSHDEPNDWREQLDVIKSKMVLDRLCFLQGCDDKDVEELVADKHCDFCNIGFPNTETLWTHMVSAHIPTARRLQCNGSITGGESQPTVCTLDSLSLNRKRTRRYLSLSALENEADVTQQSGVSSEPSCLRRSRRCRRDIWRNGRRGRARSKMDSLKKMRRRRRRSTSKSGDEDGIVTTKGSKSSNLYLADYSDKFLEEFIDLYCQQECLWQRNSPSYRSRKLKEAAYDMLLKKYCQWRKVPSVSLNKIKTLIRRIRSYYDRLKRPNANPYRSHIWQRISFIDQFPSTPSSRRSRSRDTNGTTGTDYYCSVCPRIFKRAKSCASHMLRTHPPTACPRCNESFNNADELVRHILFIHRKDAECPLCQEDQEEWKSSTHLNKHFYEQRCPTCTETFHDHTNFRRHRSKCRNINRFRCNHCSLKFTSTMDFRRHAKATHQDERPFKCDDCEVTFKYLSPLAKHRRFHRRLQRNYCQS